MRFPFACFNARKMRSLSSASFRKAKLTGEVRREEDGLDQCICDYIAGMTDKYAVGIFEAHYIPHSWTKV